MADLGIWTPAIIIAKLLNTFYMLTHTHTYLRNKQGKGNTRHDGVFFSSSRPCLETTSPPSLRIYQYLNLVKLRLPDWLSASRRGEKNLERPKSKERNASSDHSSPAAGLDCCWLWPWPSARNLVRKPSFSKGVPSKVDQSVSPSKQASSIDEAAPWASIVLGQRFGQIKSFKHLYGFKEVRNGHCGRDYPIKHVVFGWLA